MVQRGPAGGGEEDPPPPPTGVPGSDGVGEPPAPPAPAAEEAAGPLSEEEEEQLRRLPLCRLHISEGAGAEERRTSGGASGSSTQASLRCRRAFHTLCRDESAGPTSQIGSVSSSSAAHVPPLMMSNLVVAATEGLASEMAEDPGLLDAGRHHCSQHPRGAVN